MEFRRANSMGGSISRNVGDVSAVAIILLAILLELLRLSFGGVSADNVGWTESAISDSSRLFKRPLSLTVAGERLSMTEAVGSKTSSANEPNDETSSPNG